MTQVLSPNDVGVRDFTEHIDVKFKIDDDIFVGVTNIPANDLMQFGVLFDGLSEDDMAKQPDAFAKLFKLVLVDESAELFNARMSDKRRPISIGQVMNILPWLMEEYGMRPTAPSSESSPGSASPGDGTNSTANGSTPALMPAVSPQPGS